jgi:hypothetical protein
MTRLLRTTALMAALTVAAPVCAQVPMTAENLNRLEMNRLVYVQVRPAAAYPVVPYSVVVPDPVGLTVAEGIRPSPWVPGLGTLGGLALMGTGVVINTVVLGFPGQY